MKEFNIEEKAKAYDEAIKVIKDNLGALNEITETGANVVNIQSIRNCFYRAFPELKESEDEKIRKGIIRCVKGNMPDNDFRKKYIAWLEKQGKQKPAEWSEEDEEMIDEIIDYMKPMPIFFESTKGKSGKDYTKEFIKNATKWLSRLKYRVQLQKNLIATDEQIVQTKKDAYNDALD